MITRQIGWSNESNLLYQILKQLTRLGSTLFSLKEAATPKYKVFSALITQTGTGSNTSLFGDETLNIGTTYEITADTVVDMIQYGAPNNNIGTKFISNQTVSNWGDALNSLDYNQGAPVANILQNTIGNIWFTYEGVGVYYAISNGLFTSGKTSSTPIYGDYTAGVSTNILNANELVIYNNDNFPLVANLTNGIYNTLVEIKVYN